MRGSIRSLAGVIPPEDLAKSKPSVFLSSEKSCSGWIRLFPVPNWCPLSVRFALFGPSFTLKQKIRMKQCLRFSFGQNIYLNSYQSCLQNLDRVARLRINLCACRDILRPNPQSCKRRRCMEMCVHPSNLFIFSLHMSRGSRGLCKFSNGHLTRDVTSTVTALSLRSRRMDQNSFAWHKIFCRFLPDYSVCSRLNQNYRHEIVHPKSISPPLTEKKAGVSFLPLGDVVGPSGVVKINWSCWYSLPHWPSRSGNQRRSKSSPFRDGVRIHAQETFLHNKVWFTYLKEIALYIASFLFDVRFGFGDNGATVVVHLLSSTYLLT